MIYYVDFAIKERGNFNTIYTALIDAISVSECQHKADEIINSQFKNIKNNIYIFIEEGV